MRHLFLILTLCVMGCGDDTGSKSDNNVGSGGSNNGTNNSSNNGGSNNTGSTGSTNNSTNNAGSNNGSGGGSNNVTTGVGPACMIGFNDASACGGDPIGTWSLVDACVDPAPIEDRVTQFCDTATVDVESVDVTGSLNINAATYAQDVSGTVSGNVNVPASCASQAGGCSGVETALGFAGIDATCTGATDCVCATTLDATQTDVGAYTIASGTASVDSGNDYIYCVEGDFLTLREVTDGPGPVVGVYERQ